MMMLLITTVAMTASAQNTLRDKSSFTLQPKVGLGLASFSGSWEGDGDYKMKVGFVAGAEGEYYVNDWFSAALGVNKTNKNGDNSQRSDLVMFTLGYKFKL